MNSLFPQQPLTNTALIKLSLVWYKQSFVALLPVAAIIGLLHGLFILDKILVTNIIEESTQELVKLVLMLGLISAFLLTGMMLKIAFSKISNEAINYLDEFLYLINKIPSLIGVFLLAIFLPAIVFTLGVIGFFALSHFNTPFIIIGLWWLFILIVLFASVVSKIFAPLFVIIDGSYANEAVSDSVSLVKGNYWRTFLYLTSAIVLLGIVILFPAYIGPMNTTNKIILQIVSDLFLVVTLPYIVSLWIVNKMDLALRKK